MNAVASVSDKLDPLIRRLSTDKDDEVLAGPRFERTIEHLHRLGPRAVAELLTEIATATGEPGLIADHVEAYARLDPDFIRAIGGDRFPPSVFGVAR